MSHNKSLAFSFDTDAIRHRLTISNPLLTFPDRRSEETFRYSLFIACRKYIMRKQGCQEKMKMV